MTRRFDAVLFDLDGTLADTLVDIAAAANHALTQLGHAPIPVPKFRYLAGQGLEYLITHALGPAHAAQVPQGMALFRAYYADHSLDHTRPFDGMTAVLDELPRLGVRMAVLSNKPHPATLFVMEKVFGRWTFDAVLGHREGSALKPDPAGAVEIAGAMNIPADRWLYLGDTSVDMQTAVAAGMYPVGVLWGFRDEQELRESGAKVIIREPAEILRLFG